MQKRAPTGGSHQSCIGENKYTTKRSNENKIHWCIDGHRPAEPGRINQEGCQIHRIRSLVQGEDSHDLQLIPRQATSRQQDRILEDPPQEELDPARLELGRLDPCLNRLFRFLEESKKLELICLQHGLEGNPRVIG